MIFAVANLFIQVGINSFDSTVVSGNSAAVNVDNVIYNVMAAFYTACSTFMGQNWGAGKKDRMMKSYYISLGYSFVIAAVLGGMFVGIGVGLIVRQGGSSGGDDALALVIHQLTGWKLARSYLFTDLVVLGASLSYIPARRIAFSLVTVTVSSLLIDWVQGLGHDEKIHGNDAAKEIE